MFSGWGRVSSIPPERLFPRIGRGRHNLVDNLVDRSQNGPVDRKSTMVDYDLAPPTFGALLQEIRQARGLTLTEFATRAGVVPSVAFAWETGRAHPSLPRLKRVVDALRAGPTIAWRLVVAAGYEFSDNRRVAA